MKQANETALEVFIKRNRFSGDQMAMLQILIVFLMCVQQLMPYRTKGGSHVMSHAEEDVTALLGVTLSNMNIACSYMF